MKIEPFLSDTEINNTDLTDTEAVKPNVHKRGVWRYVPFVLVSLVIHLVVVYVMASSQASFENKRDSKPIIQSYLIQELPKVTTEQPKIMPVVASGQTTQPELKAEPKPEPKPSSDVEKSLEKPLTQPSEQSLQQLEPTEVLPAEPSLTEHSSQTKTTPVEAYLQQLNNNALEQMATDAAREYRFGSPAPISSSSQRSNNRKRQLQHKPTPDSAALDNIEEFETPFHKEKIVSVNGQCFLLKSNFFEASHSTGEKVGAQYWQPSSCYGGVSNGELFRQILHNNLNKNVNKKDNKNRLSQQN
ncbi:hypothetical protein J1N51_03535 [Psychrosphaera ytuae]|uniref:Uncharacterized protein n=1 Tax=Psychrosphaera ytuae TaxID=2820710 RepID=A0A975DD79_9GAMM|nr:hypothetical protein [Psychrosphaera ytuae]QTH64554.1 hypothetical protein J1N51_03535 [Psychrosphaera ytuae]